MNAMTNNILPPESSDRLEFAPGHVIAPGWKWRDRTGKFTSPMQMETRHLFFTLRMIWNNRIPAHMRVGTAVRLYTFSAYYTRDYFAQAILALGQEIMRRSDVADAWREELDQMRSWLSRSGALLIEADKRT